jgi:hypothetical protein
MSELEAWARHMTQLWNQRFDVLEAEKEKSCKTNLTLQAVVVKSTPELSATLDGMEEGWGQILDRLAEHLG